MSTNLPWTGLAENQDAPEEPINEAFAIFDAALTATYVADVTSGNANVSSTNSVAARLSVIGATTAGRIVTIVAAKRILLVTTPAANTQPVTLKTGTTEVSIEPGKAYMVSLDGTANGLELFSFGTDAEPVDPGVPEAPNDGKLYGRKNEAWSEVVSGGGGGGGIEEAPEDGKPYARKDASWVEIVGGETAGPKRKFPQYRITLASTGTELLVSTMRFKKADGFTAVPTSTTTNDSNTADVPKMFDGDDTTFWYGGSPRNFVCSFSEPFELTEIYLLQRNGQPNKNPSSMIVEGTLNGTDYTELFNGSTDIQPYAGNSDNGVATVAIDTGNDPVPTGVSGRYWRMTVQGSGDVVAALGEIRFIKKDGTRKYASAMSSSADNGNTAANLNDGNDATYWQTPNFTVTGATVTADLGSVEAIYEVRITPRADNPAFGPKPFILEVSNDGTTYTQVGAQHNHTWVNGIAYVIQYAPLDIEEKGYPNTFLDIKTDANFSITGGNNKVTWPSATIVSDVGNRWDAATDEYVVPSDGIYLITAIVRSADSSPTGRSFTISVHTSNDTEGPWMHWSDVGGGDSRSSQVYTRMVKLSVGQRLAMYTRYAGTDTMSRRGMQIIRIA